MSEMTRVWDEMHAVKRRVLELEALEPKHGAATADYAATAGDSALLGGLPPSAYGPCGQRWYDVMCYGAYGAGTSHLLQDEYADADEARLLNPWITGPGGGTIWDANPEMDWIGWQGAINAAVEAGGGRVYGPAGIYIIDTRIDLAMAGYEAYDCRGVTLCGDGYATELRRKQNGTKITALLRVRHPDDNQQICDWMVCNLHLNGNKDGGTTSTYKCLTVTCSAVDHQPARGTLRSIWAHGSSDGVGGLEGGGISIGQVGSPQEAESSRDDITIENCYCWDNGDTTGWGIGLNSNNGVRIVNCSCEGNYSMGITSWMSQDVDIIGCQCRNNKSNNINIESSRRIVVANCIARSDHDETPTPSPTPNGAGVKIFASEWVIVSGCEIHQNTDDASSTGIYIWSQTSDSQLDRSCDHILVEGCQIYKYGDDGYPVRLYALNDWWPQHVQFRDCTIVNGQASNYERGIYGDVEDLEVTSCHIVGGLDLGRNRTTNTARLLCQGNRFDFTAAANVIRLNRFKRVQVNDNMFICDPAGNGVVLAVLFISASYATPYEQFHDNTMGGYVTNVLATGSVCYPSAHGNQVGGLTLNAGGALLGAGIVWGAPVGTWPVGATIWCDFNGSTNPSCYTWNGAAWVAGANW